MKNLKLKSISFGIVVLSVVGCQTKNEKLMGNGEKILVIGRHASLMGRVLDMLKLHGYDAVGKQENEEAIAAFKTEKFQAVVIGGGVDDESRKLFHSEFSRLSPTVKIIDAHPQTILSDLKEAFSTKP